MPLPCIPNNEDKLPEHWNHHSGISGFALKKEIYDHHRRCLQSTTTSTIYRSPHCVRVDDANCCIRAREFAANEGLFFIFIYLAYFVVLEALWSRTLGKFVQGLVVRKLDGNRCDWTAALIRGFLRVFEVNPLLLGGLPAGLVIIASERKQRIGDMLAGTIVVSNKLSWSSVPSSPTPEHNPSEVV